MADPQALGWEPAAEVDEFTGLVGPLWTRGEQDRRQFGFVVQRKHLSRYARLHGGMVMWLADKAMGMAAWQAAGKPQQIATVQLDTHFIGIVAEGSFVHAECEVVRTTRSIVFVNARLLAEGAPVASAAGVWKYR